jgi:hypothetical protein
VKLGLREPTEGLPVDPRHLHPDIRRPDFLQPAHLPKDLGLLGREVGVVGTGRRDPEGPNRRQGPARGQSPFGLDLRCAHRPSPPLRVEDALEDRLLEAAPPGGVADLLLRHAHPQQSLDELALLGPKPELAGQGLRIRVRGR